MMKSVRSFRLTSLLTGALVLAVMLAPFSISQNPVIKVNGTPAGWSDESNISNSTLDDIYPSIAVSGNNIYLLWEHNYRDFFFTKSIDGGITWSPNFSIYHNSAGSLLRDDIAASGQNVHVVMCDLYGVDGIYYRNSTDGGEIWNPIKRITPDISGYIARTPHIFVNNSNVHIIWGDLRDGADGEIYYRRSLDGGISFDNGQGVDEDRRITFSPSTVSSVDMAGDKSNISIIWDDERDGHWELYWMISKDNGYTWEDGLGHAGQDRRLTITNYQFQHAIAVNGSKISIVYTTENWPGPTYNIYYLNSSDNGVTWASPVLLSGPNSASFAPNIAVYGSNIWVMWNDNRDGSHELFFKNSTDGGTTWGDDTRLTEVDGFTSGGPKVALNNTRVNVIWTDQQDGNSEIYYKRSPDFPDTFPPSHSNEIPFPDSYKDAPGTNVSVHVTDPSGVNETTIQLWINGSLVPHTSTPITDGFNVSWASGGFDPGIITCRIVADDNLGNHLDYTWNFTVLATYDIALDEGWNLISVPFEQVDTSIGEVLKDIAGKWDYIRIYDALTESWQSNCTLKPNQLNDFDALDHEVGFWIYITESGVTLTVRGNIPSVTSIPLYDGWNLVGYPSINTETVANALFGTGADKAMVCNISEPYHIKEVGPTYVMKPGEGYWVHVVADSTWIVDW